VATSFGSGLICGFRLAPPAAFDEAPAEQQPLPEPHWLHFNLSDSRARAWLQGRGDVPEEARDLLLGSDQRIHVQLLEGGFAAVLGDLHHDFNHDPERLGSLRLYVDGRLLLTGRTHPLRSVDVLRREVGRAGEPLTPVALLALLIERLADSLVKVTAELGEQVDNAEDRILEGKHAGQGTPLGNLRRLVARLRRMVGANRSALGMLPATLPGVYDAEQRAALRSAVEQLDAVGQDLDLVQERARLLQEEIAARVGEATNRNLFVLSIATTTLLPITLITGIFGMNLQGLPFAQSPHGFYFVMGGIVATVLLALSLLRRIGAL
jgi:zinc transporter